MKRKIFYFLKTKEEYDYMLRNNLIPKRGIVLIESTQEIYRNKLPYSGYGPLKTYFESLKTELQSLIQDKNEDVSSALEQIDQKLKQDLIDYNSGFQTNFNTILDQIKTLQNGLSDSDYLIKNTIVPTLENFKSNVSSLDNKNSQYQQSIASILETTNSFKSSLTNLSNDLKTLSTKHTSDINSLQNYIKNDVLKLITDQGSSSTTTLKEWVKTYITQQKMSDSELRTKVLNIVNLSTLESNLKSLISNSESSLKLYVDSEIAKVKINNNNNNGGGTNSGTGGTGGNINISYATVDYVDGKFNQLNIPASITKLGLVKVGSYLTIDADGTLSVNKTALLAGISPSSGGDSNTGGGGIDFSDDIEKIKKDIEILKALNREDIEKIAKEILDDYIDLLKKIKEGKLEWSKIFNDSGWNDNINAYLQTVGLITKNLDGSITANWTTLRQDIERIEGKVNSINVFQDENGNPISYETFRSSIISAIENDTSLASMKTAYSNHILGKEEALDFALGEMSLISSKGTSMARIINDVNGNITSLSNTVNQHDASIQAMSSFLNFTSGATFKSKVNEAIAEIYAINGSTDNAIKAAIVASVTGDQSAINLIANTVNTSGSLNASTLTAGEYLVKIDGEGVKVGGNSTDDNFINKILSNGSGYFANGKIYWNSDGSGGIGTDNGLRWTSSGAISIDASKIFIQNQWTMSGGAEISNTPWLGGFTAKVIDPTYNRIYASMDNCSGLLVQYQNGVNASPTGGICIGHRNGGAIGYGSDGEFSIQVLNNGQWKRGFTGKITVQEMGNNSYRILTFVNGICLG